MDREQLKLDNVKLMARRLKEQANSPHQPTQAKPPKWPSGSEKLLPPSDGQVWAGDVDPFKPVNLSSNLAKWEAFNWDRHPKLRDAKHIIVDWYNSLPASGALVLAGDVGCGKTHLADAIADLYGRWRIAYYGEIELVKKVQSTYTQGSKRGEEAIMHDILRADLIILDDLGTYRTSNTAFLDNIYNRIFNDFLTVRSKPLLLTTNLPMFGDGGMNERIGSRSFSRLCDALGTLEVGRYIDLFGLPDFRTERYLG